MKQAYCLYRVSTIGKVEKTTSPCRDRHVTHLQKERVGRLSRSSQRRASLAISALLTSVKLYNNSNRRHFKRNLMCCWFLCLTGLARRDDETPFVVEWFVLSLKKSLGKRRGIW